VRVDLHPEARAEFRLAALWYDERQTGRGDAFVMAINSALERVASAPESFPRWPGVTQATVIRKATLLAFPYLIAFEQHRDHIVVLGITHQKRRPLYWLRRASHRSE
jgi:toxin ParE1/3/4